MDQNVNKDTRLKDKLIQYFYKYKNKLVILFGLALILTVFFIINNIIKEKKNISISEKYIQVGLLLNSNQLEKSKILLEEIILSKNKFYSILALNILLERNLEKDKDKILKYFEVVEKSNKIQNQKDLIILKKALYLLNNSEIEKGEILLKKIIETNSDFKSIAEEILSE